MTSSTTDRFSGDTTSTDTTPPSTRAMRRALVEISTRPDPLSTNPDYVVDAFNGDQTGVSVAIPHLISGADTLGTPTTGYHYTDECYPHFTYLTNTSGHNEGTATNVGRTAAVAYRTKLANIGQGDCVAYNVSGYVSGAKGGATDFLANPAVSILNGDLTAGADGVYLNPVEVSLDGGAYDCAGVGYVANLTRNDATGSLNAYWAGYRAQSQGSAPIDQFFAGTGDAFVGIDFTQADFVNSGAYNKAALVLKIGDRIYGDGTSSGGYVCDNTGDDWIERSVSGFWNFVYANTTSLQINNDQVTVPTSLVVATHTPASASASGVAGRIVWDSSYIYICTATNTWKRAAIATW